MSNSDLLLTYELKCLLSVFESVHAFFLDIP